MNQNIFYISARSSDAKGGIYRYELNGKRVLQYLGFNQLQNASYLAFSPNQKYLFSTCTLDGIGAVASFLINSDGSLALINMMSAEGRSTCHLTTDPSGNFLYAANYSSGCFTEFRLSGGRIVERTQVIHHEGFGPNRIRQDGPHPHFTGITSDGRFLAVIDLGIDAIVCYPIDPEQGLEVADPIVNKISPPGSGPRHLVFDSSGAIAYLVNELGNSVISMSYKDGRFIPIQSCSTLPRLVDCETKASAIRLSRDEKYLFASNRGYDSIAVFELDGNGGIDAIDYVLTNGSQPRDINLLPGSTMLVAGHELSDLVVFFDYDGRGKLTPNGLQLQLPSPICVMPFPVAR